MDDEVSTIPTEVAGRSLTDAAALGRLLGLSSLHFITAPSGACGGRLKSWLSDLADGLSTQYVFGKWLVATPALDGIAVASLTEIGHRDRSSQLSFLYGHPQTKLVPIRAVIGAIGEQSGCIRDDVGNLVGILSWQVTVRDAGAAQRLIGEELGLRASVAGAAGFAGLVRALQAERRVAAGARRLPREHAALVVVANDPSD